jgi:copper homeostasis protein
MDVSIDPLEALEVIIDCGYDRVLTSGQAVSAKDGTDVIRQLVERAAGRVAIMAGAGVRRDNVVEIVRQTGVPEVHSSASVWVKDFRSTPARDALGRRETSAELVQGLRQEVDGLQTAVSG